MGSGVTVQARHNTMTKKEFLYEKAGKIHPPALTTSKSP